MTARTQRMREALDQLEYRRIEIERQIIAEIEAKFFSNPSPSSEEATTTTTVPHTLTWYGIG